MFHDHSAEAIRDRLEEGPSANYIRDWVYGGIDGAITTFAIVAGVVGADFSTRVMMILGVANLVADGFSMAASNYSGTKTEQEDFERLRAWEDRQITADPEGETAEIEIQGIGKMAVNVTDPLKRSWERGIFLGEGSTNPEAQSAS